jgi:hypothetical protein
MGSGVPTGELAVVGMTVEAHSLGERRTGVAQLGVGIPVARVVEFFLLESRECGDEQERSGWYTWRLETATQAIGPQLRASPAWHREFHICSKSSRVSGDTDPS